jgi:hypothetical protein
MANTTKGWTVTWIDTTTERAMSETYRTKRVARQFSKMLVGRADVSNMVIHKAGTEAYN